VNTTFEDIIPGAGHVPARCPGKAHVKVCRCWMTVKGKFRRHPSTVLHPSNYVTVFSCRLAKI